MIKNTAPTNRAENTSINNEKNDILDTSSYSATVKAEESSHFVEKITVKGYRLLTDGEINNIIKKHENKTLTNTEMQEIVDEINKLYISYGVNTALAFIPNKKIENKTLIINIIESRINKIKVTGNKHTKTGYIKNSLHQKEGDIVYIPEIRNDIIKFNRNNDVKLKAAIQKGSEFGTSDVILNLSETRPFHINGIFNNTGRNTVGVLTGGVNVQHDSLIGYRDRLSVSYLRGRSLSSVASNYSFPLGHSGLRVGGLFGYDNSSITSGAFKDLDIKGRTFNYSIYASKPLIDKQKFRLHSSFSLNAKNNTTYMLGYPMSEFLGTPDPKVRSMTFSLTGVKYDKTGQWVASSSFTEGLKILRGTHGFSKFTARASRVQSLGNGFILILSGKTQLSPDDLPAIEQMQIGGYSSVRGYQEGALIGRNGYVFNSELRFPIFILPKAINKCPIRNKFQGVAFAETGSVYSLRETTQHNLTSVGLGIRVKLTKFLTGRVDYGFGLINRSSDLPTAKLHFGIESAIF